MLVSRCAWHPFFRGYPRPLRVVSWRGRGIAFTDTICRSCAERIRIEGLWGPAPPPPVWPGSAQTALVFVGLPLAVALVLMATPLHDATAPPPKEEVVASAPPVAKPPDVAPPPRPAAASRPPHPAPAPVPDVVFEFRRSIRQPRERTNDARTPAPAAARVPVAPGVWRVDGDLAVTPAVRGAASRQRPVRFEPQSP
jgi:hypothetical protein